MADVFISYSKQERELTVALADDLVARGYTVWWDTSLLPGDVFEEVILQQLADAAAAIVIWTPHSVKSMWVRSEADRAREMRKLITVRASNVAPQDVPMPFDRLQADLLDNRTAIYAALQKIGVRPSARPEQDEAATDSVAAAEWEKVKATKSVEELELFEKNFGWTSHALLARERRDALLFQRAERSAALQDYVAYVEAFPNGKNAAKARERGSELSYTAAQAANTLEAFERHVKNWPGGPNERKAREWLSLYALRLQQLDQAIANDYANGRLDAPNSAVARMIAALPPLQRGFWQDVAEPRIAAALDRYDYERAQESNQPDAYRDYLRKHPVGVHREQADAFLEPFVWEAVNSANTTTAHDEYLARYPAGPHLQFAKARIAELKDGVIRTIDVGINFVESACFSPDGRLIASCGGTTVTLWDTASGLPVRELSGHVTNVTVVSFSPDGSRVISGASSNPDADRGACLKIWNVDSDRAIRTLCGRSAKVRSWTGSEIESTVESVAVSKNNSLVLSGGREGMKLWRLWTGRQLYGLNYSSYTGGTDSYLSEKVAFARNERIGLNATGFGRVQMWRLGILWRLIKMKPKVVDLKPLLKDGESRYFGAMDFNPNGRYVAAWSHRGGSEGNFLLALFDLRKRRLVRTLSKYGDISAMVAYSRCGRYVLAGWTRFIKVWDATSGDELYSFDGANHVRTASFSHDGRFILCGGGNKLYILAVPYLPH